MKVAIQNWAACSALAVGLIGVLGGAADAAVRIEGQVQIGGGALAGSTVSLWAASADAPARLAQAQSDADGRFVVSVDATPSGASGLYLVASGGTPAVNKVGGDNKGIDLLAVLGNDPPPKIVVNELTNRRVGVHQREIHQGRIDHRQSARPQDRRRERAEPRRSRDRRMGQGHSRSAQQHANDGAREPRHAWLAHRRVRNGQRRLARPLF